MDTKSQRSVSRSAYAAALVVLLVSVWTSPQQAAAQLGNLVVTITSPTSGSTVSGTIPVSADVIIGGTLIVGGVQFKLDGANLGLEDTSFPYSISWNTRNTSNGSHVLRAVARDHLGGLWTSDPVTVTVFNDITPPTVTINQAGGQRDPTNAAPINFTAVFSEPVSGFTNADVTITGTAGGTKTATVTGGPTTYNVAVSGMTSGTVIATIAAGRASDAAGNGNTGSTSTDNSVTFDNTAPTVTINQAGGQTDPTNASPINFTAVFSEPVSGFTNADVTIAGTAGGTKTVAVTGGPTTYNVAVSGMTSGTVIATIAAGMASDGAGNGNAASTSTDNSVSFASDTTRPTVTINQAAGQADPTNASPINFTAVFSEPVSGFTSGDVTIGGTAGGTKTVAVTGGPTTYNVAVSGMTSGTVIATIPAGMASDGAGNGNTGSTSTDSSVTFDNTAPTVTINQAGGQTDPTNASPINFTAVFSEPVSGFTSADVTIGGTAGGTKTVAVTGGPTTYNVAVSGMTGGTVIATIAAGVASDGAGNGNAASTSTDNSVSFTSDTTPPTVTINQAAGQADPTNASPINFTAVFSEPVSGFTSGDVTIGGTAGGTKTVAVTGGPTTYNVAVSGMTSGSVIATIAAGVASDAVGNGNTASTSTDNSVTFDTTAPTVTINQAGGQTDPTNASPINFTAVFSEPVSGFTSADVTITGTAGGTKTVAVTGGPTTYNVAVSGMTSGTVIATIAAGMASDAAGNSNTASTSTDNSVTFDTTALTVTINQAAGQPDPTNASPINFTAVFSEPVSDFASADVTIAGTAGGTKTVAVTGGPTTYNVAVSGMTGGTVIATIAAGMASDGAGNGNTASTSTDNSVTLDNTAPTVTINQAAGQTDPTNASPINFTAVFSEPVSGFTNADVTITGTAGGTKTVVVTGGPTTYNVAVSGMTTGTVIATIAAGMASDGAGNGNTASTSTDNSVSFASDTTPPTVTINQAAGQADPTSASPINFTVVFSEPVSDFASADVTIAGTAGGTKTVAVTGGPTTYNVAVSGMTDGTVIATIAAAMAHDAAGNGNTASTSTDNSVTFTASSTVTRVEETSSSIAYTGSWVQGSTSRPWSGGTAAIANGGPASDGSPTRATLSFTGTGVSWIGFRGPQTGIAQVFLDGTLVATVDLYAAAEEVTAVVFTTSGLASGTHTLAVENTGTKNAASADILVVVDAFDVTGVPTSDTAPPSVSISAPSAGATVSGTTTVSANASDDVGVAGVQFMLDGAPLGAEDTTAPYAVAWNTTGVVDGSHTLTAVARDQSGKTTTSAAVTVTVSNGLSSSSIPVATRFENTDLSITYIDGSVSSGPPPDWWHGSRSRAWSNDTASFNRAANARATFTFTGTAVRWIGFRAPWAGIADVFLDGAFAGEFDLYSAVEQIQATIFSATGLTAGSHTLAVQVTGLKNASSTDTAVVVDAFDVSPASPPPTSGTRFEETPSSTYTAGWTQGDTGAAWSGGTAAVSTTTAARATFVFTGTSVKWVGLRGPQSGIARVFLDGAFQADVDTYSPNDVQEAVFTASSLAPARHTLTIEVTGLKNSAATGNRIVVDAFDVQSRVEDTDPSIGYTLTDPAARWIFEHTNKAWSGTSANTGTGTAALSATAGARAEFTFTGTAVTWIGFRGPIAGIANVSLDGSLVATLDLYSPTEALRAPVFTRTGLAAGQHTLRIDVTGQKNASATGSYVVVDAFDVPLPTPAPPVTRFQQTEPSIVYTPSSDWTLSGQNSLYSGQTVTLSATPGAQAEFTFTGTSIRWIGQRLRETGIARVFLDGVLVGDIDTFADLQDEYQAVVFSRTGLGPGQHRLTIVVTGTKNPASAATTIYVDAFEVY